VLFPLPHIRTSTRQAVKDVRGVRGRSYRGLAFPLDQKPGGTPYLYDACFGTGPCEIDSPLPPDDFSVWGGAQLSSFKSCYLDAAVDYMLGSLYNGSVLYRSDPATETNGMTVRTALIPEMIGAGPGLTFYWGDG
jgi:hypothetical protein